MADSARARRLAKRIAAIVATELELRVKDPRLAMITITAATVTPDLREAVVFYTVYGNDDDVTSTAAALTSATGVIRSAVGRETGIKFTPTVVFRLDTIPENAHKIDDLIAAAKASDAAVASQAAGAAYAGDADPYKVPRVLDEDPDDSADPVDGEDGDRRGGDGGDGAVADQPDEPRSGLPRQVNAQA